jgi:hypothetical protein
MFTLFATVTVIATVVAPPLVQLVQAAEHFGNSRELERRGVRTTR